VFPRSSARFVLPLVLGVVAPRAVAATVEGGDDLARMVGKSASELERDHGPALRALLDDGRTRDASAFAPWHVWSFDEALGDRRYVVFAASPIAILPGHSGAEVLLLSSAGKELGRWRFSTGWRIDVRSAELARNDDLRAPVIAIHTAPMVNGRDVTVQYFALAHGRLSFVRAEDSHGQLVRNDYTATNHTLGGEPSADSVAGWNALLASDDPISELTALVYISGLHAPLGARGNSPEVERDARTARDLEAAAGTSARIGRLRHSPHRWIQEAARFFHGHTRSPAAADPSSAGRRSR
jgi:hypothetical protein